MSDLLSVCRVQSTFFAQVCNFLGTQTTTKKNLMPLEGVLAICLALWQVAYIRWVMICRMCMM